MIGQDMFLAFFDGCYRFIPVETMHYLNVGWRRSREGYLRQFVTVVAAKHNEISDTNMWKYRLVLEQEIDKIGRSGIVGQRPLPKGRGLKENKANVD
jgi:hypothetical protein